jgi:hypothetical protein
VPEGQPPVYDPGTRRAPLRPITPSAGSYGGSPPRAGGGGGFEYDEATLHELVREWNDLANEFRNDQRRAQQLAQTQGPGLEYASEGNADRIRSSGRALLETLGSREDYCRAMAKKFETALGKYATAEDVHSTEIEQTGGTL